LAVFRLITSSNLVGCKTWKIGRFFALENAADIAAGLAVLVDDAGAIADQAAIGRAAVRFKGAPPRTCYAEVVPS